MIFLAAKRAPAWRLECYHRIYKEATTSFQQGRRQTNAALVHGSLLVLGELLLTSSDFFVTRFEEVCDIVLRHQDYNNQLVRDTVIALLPRLVHINSPVFVKRYLDRCMDHLLTTLRSGNR